MALIQVDKKTKGYFDYLSKDLTPERLRERIARFFQTQGQFAAAEVIKRSGDRLKVRSGSLRRSIIGRGELVNGLPGLRVGTLRGPGLKYARVQEFGTKGLNPNSPIPTIKPKRAKALAVPLAPKALTAAGQARYPSPRDYPGKLSFVPFRRGIAVGALYDEKDMKRYAKAQAKGRKASLRNYKAVFLLLKKVDIKPHYFVRDGLIAYLPKLTEKLSVFLKAVFVKRTGFTDSPPGLIR